MAFSISKVGFFKNSFVRNRKNIICTKATLLSYERPIPDFTQVYIRGVNLKPQNINYENVNFYYGNEYMNIKDGEEKEKGSVIELTTSSELKPDEIIIPVHTRIEDCRYLFKIKNNDRDIVPFIYETFKETLLMLRTYISQSKIIAMVDHKYMATITINCDGSEIEMNCRVGDALTMALIFDSPIYVHDNIIHFIKNNCTKGGNVMFTEEYLKKYKKNKNIIFDTEMESYVKEIQEIYDPTLIRRLEMQIAINKEDYKKADRIKKTIEHTMEYDKKLKFKMLLEKALKNNEFSDVRKYAKIIRDIKK